MTEKTTSTGESRTSNASSARKELLEAWRTNHRINMILIDRIVDEGMSCTLSKRGGRGVAGEFAHMHNVRVWHLEKRAKKMTKGLTVFKGKTVPTKAQLRKALNASAKGIENLLAGIISGDTNYRGFKRGIFTTLAYFVSHEAHHRGRILLTLKVSRHTLDKNTQVGIWAWDNI